VYASALQRHFAGYCRPMKGNASNRIMRELHLRSQTDTRVQITDGEQSRTHTSSAVSSTSCRPLVIVIVASALVSRASETAETALLSRAVPFCKNPSTARSYGARCNGSTHPSNSTYNSKHEEYCEHNSRNAPTASRKVPWDQSLAKQCEANSCRC
jgi:hypothetical protein